MELADYLRAVLRGWWLVVGMTVLAAGAALAYAGNATPIYRSTVDMLVIQNPGLEPGVVAGSPQERANAYAEVLIGDRLARRIIEDVGIDSSPGELRRQLDVRTVADTLVLRVTAEDASPELARDIAAAVGEYAPDLMAAVERPDAPQQAPVLLRVVEPPSVPHSPAWPRPALLVIAAVVIGVLLGVAVALAVEGWVSPRVAPPPRPRSSVRDRDDDR